MARAAPIPVAPPATTATLLARRDMGRYSFVVELLLIVVGRVYKDCRPGPHIPWVSLGIGAGRRRWPRRGLILRGAGAPPWEGSNRPPGPCPAADNPPTREESP